MIGQRDKARAYAGDLFGFPDNFLPPRRDLQQEDRHSNREEAIPEH
jgi:hypothetical protein